MSLGGARKRQISWIVTNAAVALVIGTSCGGGCGGCGFEPIPGGFPSAERMPNAVQVRVSSSGITTITNNPAALISGFGSGPAPGVVSFGGIDVDLNRATNDTPRLELVPRQGQSQLGFTMRARLKTPTPMQVDVPLAGTCDLTIDTTENCGTVPNPPNPNDGNHCDVTITGNINFTQGSPEGTTRIQVANVGIANLTDDDIDLGGSFACDIANGALSFATGFLVDQFQGQIEDTINGQVCKSCPGGTVDECGPFASTCEDNVCKKSNGDCLQELGLAGRARGTALFGALSPGTTGAIDLYEVAGGYATTNAGGIALGMLGGIVPGGAARDRCGPMATAPANATIGLSNFFDGNTRPDPPNEAFDVAFGVHKSQLADFAYAGYDGGLLCLTISNATVSQLSTDTISLLSRSLANLVEGNSPMAVGLRPQSPPGIVLGKNVFTDDGQGNVTLTEPLLDITFTQMEIDFFAAIDDQYVRVFTVVADVHFPIGLQVTGMGELQPVIGNPDDAFTNLSVKNSEALTEAPAEIADLFPAILGLALPQLSGGLSPISLPDLGGLQLSVTDITAVPTTFPGSDNDFLAIFANLTPAVMQRPVDTTATVGVVYHPPTLEAQHPRTWKRARQPSVDLHLGGTSRDLQYSWKIDGGSWSAWSTNPNPRVTSPVFWLPGTHEIEVRARERDRPETIDLSPVTLTVETGANAGVVRRAPKPFHGQAGAAGCSCDANGGDPMAAAPFALLVVLLLLPIRRLRRRVRRLGTLVWLAAIACLPACSCGSDYCGPVECLDGDIPHGGLGRWTSIAGDEERVLVATYDQGLGDVVAADVTDPDAIALVAVDGIPTDVTPTHDEGSYRRGIAEPGPDVGAWTSIVMSTGLGRMAYQDRDALALKLAIETRRGVWASHVVDPGNGEEVGRYTSTVIDGGGLPAIAYVALGNDDGSGHRVTELRVARTSKELPNNPGDWITNVIVSGNGTCAGKCAPGEACTTGMEGQVCAAITDDCAATCGDGEACVAGACVESIPDPEVADLATGTGLFVDLLVLPDDRLAAVYYDRNQRSLMIAVEDAANTNVFTETVLDGGTNGDRGMWASAIVDGSGTVHIAYQDALGDQLFYTTFNGTPGVPELVDDGQREGDRTHNVGAAAAIYLVSGSPQIAYQDGLTSDVYLATKSGSTWMTSGIAVGPLLDGFSIGATTGHGQPYLAWDRLDPALTPVNGLAVQVR